MTDELPPGWALTTVGAVCPTTQYGYTASASQIECGPRFLRITDIQDGAVNWDGVPFCEIAECEVEKYAIASGDLLVARTGGTVGKSFLISVVPGPTVFASYLIRISPASEIAPAFLYYFFQSASYWQQIGLKKGGLLGNVNAKTLASIELPLCPEPEQQRIVSKIDELFSRIDEGERALGRVQKLVERYRQSVLKAAVTGGLTRDWREKNKDKLESGEALLARILKARREAWETAELDKMKAKGITPTNDKWKQKYQEPVGPDTTDLSPLPTGWLWASVEQLGFVQLGRQRSPDKIGGANPVKYIRAANITTAGVDLGDVKEMDFDRVERVTFRLHPGDVLLTEASGSAQHVGRPALWSHAEEDYCFQNTVLRIRPCLVASEYVFRLMQAAQEMGRFKRLSAGVGINHLSAGKLSAFAVPLPPIAEQAQIIERLAIERTSLEAAFKAISVEARRAEALRHGILRAAFCGLLTHQDPADEAASALLQRIAAERSAARAKPKRGRKPKTSETA